MNNRIDFAKKAKSSVIGNNPTNGVYSVSNMAWPFSLLNPGNYAAPVQPALAPGHSG